MSGNYNSRGYVRGNRGFQYDGQQQQPYYGGSSRGGRGRGGYYQSHHHQSAYPYRRPYNSGYPGGPNGNGSGYEGGPQPYPNGENERTASPTTRTARTAAATEEDANQVDGKANGENDSEGTIHTQERPFRGGGGRGQAGYNSGYGGNDYGYYYNQRQDYGEYNDRYDYRDHPQPSLHHNEKQQHPSYDRYVPGNNAEHQPGSSPPAAGSEDDSRSTSGKHYGNRSEHQEVHPRQSSVPHHSSKPPTPQEQHQHQQHHGKSTGGTSSTDISNYWVDRLQLTGDLKESLSKSFEELDSVNKSLLKNSEKRLQLDIEVARYERLNKSEENRCKLTEEKLEAMDFF